MDVLVKRFALAIGLGISTTLSAQDSLARKFEPLSIDRPDVSNLPTTVLPGHFQFELGGESSQSSFNRKFEVPNLIFRTGLNKKAELRVGFTNVFEDSLKSNVRDKSLVTTLSAKYRFVEEKGLRPSIAVQPEVALPFGHGSDIDQSEANFTLMDYSLLVLFNNTLHKKVFLNYNTGILANRNGELDFLLSASASFAHTHRLGYFFETYSIFNDTGFPLSFDGGVVYLVHPRVQFDIYGGNRDVGGSRHWFYGGGIGFRLDPEDIRPESFKKTGIHH
jgi:Putative MetA-pathway of phenol degradation